MNSLTQPVVYSCQLLDSHHPASLDFIRPFASGGTSELWEVRQIDGQRKRACLLKVLRPFHAQSPLWRAMFAREIHLNRLLGGYVTPWPLAVGSLDTRPFYTMVRMQGWDLRTILQVLEARRCLLKPAHAVALITYLARVLSQLHEGVMWDGTRVALAHRDLSPDNILVTPQGSLRILDLGAALPVLPGLRHTKNFAVGKIRYMAPEFRAEGIVDLRGDIYAFGRIMEDILHCSAKLPLSLESAMADMTGKCTVDSICHRWRSMATLVRFLEQAARKHGISLDMAPTRAHLKTHANIDRRADVEFNLVGTQLMPNNSQENQAHAQRSTAATRFSRDREALAREAAC